MLRPSRSGWMCPACRQHGACTDAVRCCCPCRDDAPQLPAVVRDAYATPADRPAMVAPRLAAPPAVRTAGGTTALSEGDGDTGAVRDLLSRRGGETNPFARAAADNAREAELAALVEAYRRGKRAGRLATERTGGIEGGGRRG